MSEEDTVPANPVKEYDHDAFMDDLEGLLEKHGVIFNVVSNLVVVLHPETGKPCALTKTSMLTRFKFKLENQKQVNDGLTESVGKLVEQWFKDSKL